MEGCPMMPEFRYDPLYPNGSSWTFTSYTGQFVLRGVDFTLIRVEAHIWSCPRSGSPSVVSACIHQPHDVYKGIGAFFALSRPNSHITHILLDNGRPIRETLKHISNNISASFVYEGVVYGKSCCDRFQWRYIP